jgi:mRNA-degrading endonuclease toxin of MazEF toxin-antitoxin module
VVAEITTNIASAIDPANLLIEINTPDGKLTGLLQDSVVTCLHLATMNEERVGRNIGCLSPALLSKVNNCLKVAFGLP